MQGVPDDATAATSAAAATASDGKSDAWSEYYKRPALSRALKVLAGVCKGHTASQQVVHHIIFDSIYCVTRDVAQ
jgi:E3 ubiquitin-protein ligase UBR4